MNCKPGDLAVVARLGARGFVGPLDPAMLGRVVRVVSLADDFPSPVAMWRLETPLALIPTRPFVDIGGHIAKAGVPVSVVCLPDAVLRPLRPGFGPDETLAWKQVPGASHVRPEPEIPF